MDASAEPVKSCTWVSPFSCQSLTRQRLTYLESSEMRIALILSVWPTSFPVLLADLGSHSLTTRSGEPDATVRPKGSEATAYTEDFAADASAGFKVTRGSFDGEALLMSQSLMVLSNEPEATQFCSLLIQCQSILPHFQLRIQHTTVTSIERSPSAPRL